MVVEELTDDSFKGVDIALFSAGGSQSKRFAPIAVRHGTVVVDNSSAFRMDAGVPLVVPEINPQAVREHQGIIANPNCSTIISITPLWPIHQVNRIQRLIVATYQAASGAGAAAMEELRESTRAYLDGKPYENTVLPHPYAFNLFSHNAAIDPLSGYNEEEIKVMRETHKIFGDSSIRVTATCVRVPVLRAHSIALNFECERPITATQVTEMMKTAPGVKIVDDRGAQLLPDAERRLRPGPHPRRPHPPGRERPERPLHCNVRRGRPTPQRRCPQRRADRGVAAEVGCCRICETELRSSVAAIGVILGSGNKNNGAAMCNVRYGRSTWRLLSYRNAKPWRGDIFAYPAT